MAFSGFRSVVFLPVAFVCLTAAAFGQDDYKPWALRDHYSFQGEHSVFKVDVQTGEWLVEVSNLGLLVTDVQCEIEYADGRTLRLSNLRAFKDDRESFDGPLGEGTRFRSLFKAEDGLEIDYSVARFKTRPFLMIHVNLVNHGTKPIAIREIRPAVFDRGCVADLGDAAAVSYAPTRRRGNFSMMSEGKGSGLVLFTLKSPKMTLGVGVLRSGLVDSFVDVREEGKSWVGAVRNKYVPSLEIQPNSRVGSDPVWMSLYMSEPAQVTQVHAWSEITGMKSMTSGSVPQGWVTIAAGRPATELYGVAEAWSGNNVHHALVPSGWQEKPGSLNGRAPAYPRDMSRVAKEIIALGMIPGITIDPLAIDESDGKLTVTARDGSHWLNLGTLEARALAAKRVQKLVGQGFQFFVVEPSAIPDEMLQKMNATREQSDSYALQLVTDAAGGYPVLPSPGLSLGGALAQWQDVGRATAGLRAYGVSAGPLRLDADQLKDVPRALSDAIGNYDGPLEIVGTPKKDVRAAVGLACCAQEPPRRAPAQAGSRD